MIIITVCVFFNILGMEETTENNTSIGAERENNDNNQEDNRSQNPTRTALDELIQEDAKLKENLEAALESKRKWRIRNAALGRRNSKLELEVKKLRDDINDLQGEVVTKSEESHESLNELETYKSRNKQEATQFWKDFEEETQKYSNLFTNGHLEYSSNCLMQEIEGYRRHCSAIRDKINDIEKDMEALRVKYGLVDSSTNEQANLLKYLNDAKKAISDKTDLIRATKSAENDIAVLKLKVKQKIDEIVYLQNKSI
ncbi:structural maintenance of chromosomes protein 2-like [Venturia canescens]|uniref:structural maintenance of chromosomes protein 2-like n=1 Tax=Venturia canescens TaxID=32260 RepID=UPI001C9BEA4F|nr:structural maintenance of chromosomes protein 2-like [Venturia canescens]